jgi:hypothetical protein
MVTSNELVRICSQHVSERVAPTTKKLGEISCCLRQEGIKKGLTKLVLGGPIGGLDAAARDSVL